MKRLILIDSNALVHRAFHALPPTLVSPKGVITNAVYGFISVFLKMLKELKPDYIAATYDLAGPTFRHEEFAEYKIHREKAPDELYNQIPPTKDILRAFGVPIYERPGFEADDLIGALAEKAKKNPPVGGLQVIIVTGDLDTLQLVDGDRVVVFTLRKGLTDTILYDEKEVAKRYGLKPEQVTDFKGLKGDPSDNIPGVPGIGEKTASALIQEFGSMEKLYDELESKNGKIKIKNEGKKDKKSILSEKLIQKLTENKDQAFFSKKLATIIRDVDVDFDLNKADWRNNLDLAAITGLFKEFGFYSLIKRLDDLGIGAGRSDGGSQDGGQNESGASSQKLGRELAGIKTIEGLPQSLEAMAKAKEIIFSIRDDNFAWTENCRDFFSFNLNDLGLKQVKNESSRQKLSDIFEDEEIKKTGHDLKPSIKFFLENGLHARGVFFDTKIAAYLLKADRKDYDIETMYRNEFGQDLLAGDENRLIAIDRLKKLFWEKLKSDGLVKVFEEIEMPLIGVLAEVELAGIKISLDSLDHLSKSVIKELGGLEKEIHKLAGAGFNINSPRQLKEILFERLKLRGRVRKTAKGALSTAAGELEKLAGEHPIIDLILRHRELQKLKTTYIEPFPRLVDPKTGRLHTTFNQTGTVTGRLSSQDPNLQNIPVRTELGQEFRKSFISLPGYKLISFDYSQLELRIAAHISRDDKMIAAFKRGEDIHTRTAAEIFEVAPKDVTKEMRREAKVMNFGLLYGMGLLGFQRAAEVSRDRAREFIDRYMREFSGIAEYMEKIKEKARKDGYVSTIFGRRRYLPEINSGIPQLIAQAERMAINHPIQGTEGDFLRIAMNRVYNLIHKEYNDRDVKILLQVHDELLFEVKNSLVKTVVPKIKSLMEGVCELSVPLVVVAKAGDNWRDLEEI